MKAIVLISALVTVNASSYGKTWTEESRKNENIISLTPSRSCPGATGNGPVQSQKQNSNPPTNSYHSRVNGVTSRNPASSQTRGSIPTQSESAEPIQHRSKAIGTQTDDLESRPIKSDEVIHNQDIKADRYSYSSPDNSYKTPSYAKSTTTADSMATRMTRVEPYSSTRGSGGSYHSTMIGASERVTNTHMSVFEFEQITHPSESEIFQNLCDSKCSNEFFTQNDKDDKDDEFLHELDSQAVENVLISNENKSKNNDDDDESSQNFPSSAITDVHLNILDQFRDNFLKSAKNVALMNAASKVNLREMLLNRQAIGHDFSVFSHKLKQYLTPLNQEKSFTCSIFPIIRAMQHVMIKNFNLDTTSRSRSSYALSAWHISFHDLLEKVNSFLEFIIETEEISLESECISLFLEYGISQSSDWNTNIRLIQKYGIVPSSLDDAGVNSKRPYFIIELLNVLIHKGALEIFEKKSKVYEKEGWSSFEKKDLIKRLRGIKKNYLQEAFNILSIGYGKPVHGGFKWEAFSVDDKAGQRTLLKFDFTSPIDFYERMIGINFSNQVTLCNYPGMLEDKLYSLTAPPRIKELPNRNFINLSVNKLSDYAVKAVLAGNKIIVTSYWDAFDPENLVLDTKRFDYQSVLGFNKYHSKELSYQTRDWTSIHALLIVGVDVDQNDRPVSWQLENSWGSESGILNMSQNWFEHFVYEIIVPRELLNIADVDILNGTPIKKDFMTSLKTFDEIHE